MSLRDADGNRLFRRVEVNIIFPPDIFPVKRLMYKAEGARKAYGPDGIDQILMNIADQLDSLYPWWEFRMIPLAPLGRVARYTFTVVGIREMAPDPPQDENTFPPENKVLSPDSITEASTNV